MMKEDRALRVTFVGASSALPTADEETAGFVLNGVHLVDAPCGVVRSLLRCGIDPMAIRTVIFTHFHQDHYMGLPQLLFYRGLKASWQGGSELLTLYGPSDIELVVKLTREFLRVDEFPVVWPNLTYQALKPGEVVACSGYRLEAAAANHAVEDLCYRFTDLESGASVVFTGDTAYHEPLSEFARGCDLLIHEASFCGEVSREAVEQTKHSTAAEAARIASKAGAGMLALIHYDAAKAEQALQEARAVFPNTVLAKTGLTLDVRPAGRFEPKI
jgi:ribonuclease Z